MRFITLLLLLLSISVYSQEFHEQLAIESCECVAQIDLESLTYEQREVQLGVCLIVSLGKFSKELENTYGKTFIDFDEKEQILLFEKVGFKMWEICPVNMMNFSDDFAFHDSEDFPSVEFGKISTIQQNQFNTVVLRLGDGSLNNFLWLWDFEGSDILIEKEYIDKWINIFYIEAPMYNPETSSYVNYKIIDKIELGE